MDCQSFLLRLVILKASRKTTRHWLILNAFRYVTTIYYQASQPFLPLWQAWKVMFAQHTGQQLGIPGSWRNQTSRIPAAPGNTELPRGPEDQYRQEATNH